MNSALESKHRQLQQRELCRLHFPLQIHGNLKFFNPQVPAKSIGHVPRALKKKIDFKNIYGGVTEMADNNGLVIKTLSNDLNDLHQVQTDIWKVFRKTETGMEIPMLRMYY